MSYKDFLKIHDNTTYVIMLNVPLPARFAGESRQFFVQTVPLLSPNRNCQY